ncbi:MAG: translation initiation factor IF-2 [Candidatus Absconditicoccaceae bacterium]
MPRIEDVIQELGVQKQVFAKFYEKIMDKPMTAKVVTVSDKNLEQIKELMKKNESKIKKTTSEPAKFLKADELGKSSGFLSGLGFAPVKEEEYDIEIEDIVEEEKQEVKPQDEFTTFSTQKKEEFIQKKEEHSDKKPSDKPVYRPPYKPGDKPTYRPPYKPPYKPGDVKKPFIGGSGNKYPQSNQTIQKKEYKPEFIKREKVAATSANLIKKQEVEIDEKITVKEFSEKIGVPLPEIMKKLLENKILTGITSSLDFDTACLIGADLGVILKKKQVQMNVESFMTGDLQSILDIDKGAENLIERAPIVTIMGHVDHGKTSLLDYLRKTNVAGGEAGGITQSIGASVVEHNGKKIAFIDTPGHELFTSLRARGAKLTNIAVIVIAADDSVMPQTVESINHAKSAGVPIIIAVTKIDKPGNNFEQIKADIAKYGLTPEDRGGETPIVGISSKTGQGIPDLLENILLQTEMLELKYNPDRSAVGVILDAHKDPKQGVVTSVIILTGTLKVGDIMVAYNTYGKVKRMQNWKGQNISSATGGEPAQILGFTAMPEPGRMIEVVKNEKEANERVNIIQDKDKKQTADSAVQEFLSGLQSADNKISELRLILKSDGSSSLEALQQAVAGIVLPENVVIKTVHTDVGHFGDSDLSLAQASKALLLGFNLSMNALLKKKAETMKVEMKSFDIIYELTDYLTDLTKGMIKLEEYELVVGTMEVLGIFYTKGKDMTIGGKIIQGKVVGTARFRIMRGDEILGTGDIVSLHRNKDQVKEVGEGEECGIKIRTSKRIEIGDKLEFFVKEMR